MTRDAEAHADEDSKKRDEVDARNQAESFLYNAEKTLKDAGDKVSESEAAPAKIAMDDLREALKGDDISLIKAKQESLTNAMYSIAEKLYPKGADGSGPPPGNAGAGPFPGADAGGNPFGGGDSGGTTPPPQNDNIRDADFEEVK